MEDKERGSLEQKPALELILELYHGGVTGSLKLERTPLQKAVYFRDGQILFAASNDPKDQLASILVEEGKLGPDQMQVAQARVSSGNPLAKVLTELGYITQRELAEAARVKVARILTDLYMWTEGNFEFATKSLSKGAIDLDLSTPHLITASIRRIQDRDWVLRELGSLETALTPSEILDTFINETKADAQTIDVLRQADGTKTVQEIASLSNLGEFEVCKILAAAVVVGRDDERRERYCVRRRFRFSDRRPRSGPSVTPRFFELTVHRTACVGRGRNGWAPDTAARARGGPYFRAARRHGLRAATRAGENSLRDPARNREPGKRANLRQQARADVCYGFRAHHRRARARYRRPTARVGGRQSPKVAEAGPRHHVISVEF